MKKNLHPQLNKVEVQCVTCENKFTLKTTAKEIKVDVCAECHPFYTGKMTSGSAKGRIERFNQKFGNKDNK